VNTARLGGLLHVLEEVALGGARVTQQHVIMQVARVS